MNLNLFVTGRHLDENQFALDDVDNSVRVKAAPGEALQIALETAFLNLAFPVGTVLFHSSNPADFLGVGGWVAFGAGRVLVGVDESNTLFNSVEKLGGSYDALLAAHVHGMSGTTSSAGDHSHLSPTSDTNAGSVQVPPAFVPDWGADFVRAAPTTSNGAHSHAYSGVTSTSTGVSSTNANIQPYITVKMWKRTY